MNNQQRTVLCFLLVTGILMIAASRCDGFGPDNSIPGILGAPDRHDQDPDVIRDGSGGAVPERGLRREAASALLVEVRLPDGATPAVGAIVHAVPGDSTAVAEDQSVPVEIRGRLCGRSDAAGRLTIPLPVPRLVSARLGAMYTEEPAVAVGGVVTIVLSDDLSPWIRVVDIGANPVVGVEVEVMAGRFEVVATATTNDAGVARFDRVWPGRDVAPRLARVRLVGRAVVHELDRESSEFPIVMCLGAVGRLSVATRPLGIPTVVNIAAVASAKPGAEPVGPTKLLRDVAAAEVVVPIDDLSFVVAGWRADGRAVEASPVVGLVPNERREVVLDFSGRVVRGRLRGVNVGEEVTAFVFAGGAWRARPLQLGTDGAFQLTLDEHDVRLVFTTPEACSAEFVEALDGPEIDLGAIVLMARPVLGTVTVFDESGNIASGPLLPMAVRNTRGQWVGFGLRAPLTLRPVTPGTEDSVIEVLGMSGVTAARLAPHRAGCHPLPEFVEVSDGANATCKLVAGAMVDVWLVDSEGTGVREFWLRDGLGAIHTRVTAKRTERGSWARFMGLRPGAYTLEMREGHVVAPTVEVTTSGIYELLATMQ
jgi:protocatechuate 3,4-dioxygenase beta subunit